MPVVPPLITATLPCNFDMLHPLGFVLPRSVEASENVKMGTRALGVQCGNPHIGGAKSIRWIRRRRGGSRPPVDEECLFRVVDALEAVAKEMGKTVPQIALNWVLQRPTVSSIIIGARNEEQLRQNLGAVGWKLTTEQIAKLDAASAVTAPYPHFPYRRQEGFARLSPPIAG